MQIDTRRLRLHQVQLFPTWGLFALLPGGRSGAVLFLVISLPNLEPDAEDFQIGKWVATIKKLGTTDLVKHLKIAACICATDLE